MTPMQSDSIGELAKALAAVQSKLEGARKSAQNPHLKNRYADLGDVWDACRDVLSEAGLAVAQTTDFDGDTDFLVTTLMHAASGQWKAGRLRLRYGDDERGRSIMQALGSSLTYARRYALAAIVGVVQEDDDGQSAGATRSRPEPARQQTQPERPAPTRRSFEAILSAFLDHWHAFEPIADEAEETSRKLRLVNELITCAIKDERVREGDTLKPAEAGKGPTRDARRAWQAAKALYESDPDYVRLTWKEYLIEKKAAAVPSMTEAEAN